MTPEKPLGAVTVPPRSEGEVALAAHGLTKRYGDTQALRGVSFEAHRGEMVAVVGPNGAGKTTLLSILAGIQRPSSGRVDRSVREIGWVPQQTALYGKLTAAENLRLFARLERVEDVEGTVGRMLDQTGLRERADDETSSLSGGNRQRLNVAIGLLADPPVVLLDEPSAALDPPQRERLWAFVEALAGKGTTVVYTTHHLDEVEHHADRVIVLADGELLFSGTPAALETTVPGDAEIGFEAAFVRFLRERGH